MAASSTDYMTIGGAVVKIDDATVGYTDNGIEVERTLEIKDFEDGIPMLPVLRTPIRDRTRIKFPMMEVLDADKLAAVSLNIPVDTIAGGTDSVVDGDNEEHIFGEIASSNMFQAIQLTGTLITSLVMKNVAEDTTYTAEDDYFLDSVAGIAYRNPAGDITEGQTVRVVYGYTEVASKRLRLGNNNALTPRKVEVIHTSPVAGRVLRVVLWKAYFDGKLTLNPQKEEYWKTESECLGTPHASHPTEPVGYIDIAAA